jgi:hypothetical protein
LVGLVKESTNPHDFVKQTAVATLWSGILAGLVVAWQWGWSAASGFEFAVVWGLANFAVLAVILRNATRPEGARVASLAGWVALKLIGLYGLAILVLLHRWFPLGAFAVGMGWPLVIIALRSLAPAGLPRRPRESGVSPSDPAA